MKRDTFLKSLASLAACAAFPMPAHAALNLKMLIPANTGGGWDSTGRALGAAILEGRLADGVQYDNKGGSAGAIGLAEFLKTAKGDPTALMMGGAVMLGGLIAGKSTLPLHLCTPIARLTSEYNVFAVAGDSPIKTMADVIAQLKKEPGSVKWGGGSRGSTEHIAACQLARNVRVDPKKVNYVAHKGGGEAAAAILSGAVTVGGSGYSEFSEYFAEGKMRPIGITSQKRLTGINIPTLKELGYDVVIGNWRGVYGAPGINPEQRAALTDIVLRATKTKAWQDALQKHRWTPAVESGKELAEFLEYESASMQAIMYLSGML